MNQQTNSGACDLVSGKIKHTATPWAAVFDHPDEDTAKSIAFIRAANSVRPSPEIASIYGCDWDAQQAANAEFIVRAVNAHDDLVAALEGVIRVADRATDELDAARAALAKATAK